MDATVRRIARQIIVSAPALIALAWSLPPAGPYFVTYPGETALAIRAGFDLVYTQIFRSAWARATISCPVQAWKERLPTGEVDPCCIDVQY